MNFVDYTKKTEYIGKIAAVGQRGCGQSHCIISLANQNALETKYPWIEDEEIAGTSSITPFDFQIRPFGRFIIDDNPSYPTLKQIRLSLKQYGNIYSGMIVFADGIGWNFRRIGIYHAEQLRKFSAYSKIPILLMVTKRDLVENLLKNEIFHDFCTMIAEKVEKIVPNQKVKYFNRVKNTLDRKQNINDNSQVSFTVIEQVLVNEISLWNKSKNIPHLNFMNIRFLIRALLLGILETQYLSSKKLINEKLINSLNYYRPTTLETGLNWSNFNNFEDKNSLMISEPVIAKEKFSKNKIKTIFLRNILASEDKVEKLYDQYKNLKELNKWNLVGCCFSESKTRDGRNEILKSLINLIAEMKNRSKSLTKLKKSKSGSAETIESLGLDQF